MITVNNYSNGIKSKIFKEKDNFHRMDCDLGSGLYIGNFIINKDSAGKIDSVYFDDPIGNKSEVIVRDSKDLETLKEAFKNYNEHIKAFYKKDYLERKPYPVRLLGY